MLFKTLFSILSAALPIQGVPKILHKVFPAIVEIGASEKDIDELAERKKILEFLGKKTSKDLLFSSGSGVIIEESGLVVTSAKCINDQSLSIKIRLNTREEHDAKIIDINSESGLAFLQISNPQHKKFHFLKIADSDKVHLGDFVVTAANAMGIGHSSTAGLVSMPNRVFNDKVVMQLDAEVYPGNKGGAVIGGSGALVGVIWDHKMAIPSNLLNARKEEIKGKKGRADFGLSVCGISKILRGQGIHRGVLVQETSYNSKLQRGDIVTKINDKPINSVEEFSYREKLCYPSQIVTLQICRNGKYFNQPLKASQSNEDIKSSKETKGRPSKIIQLKNDFIDEMEITETNEGLKITRFEGRCHSILREGDVVLEINGKTEKKDILEILKLERDDESLDIKIKRSEKEILYKIEKLRNHFVFANSIVAEKIIDRIKTLIIVSPDINMMVDTKNKPLKSLDTIKEMNGYAISSLRDIKDIQSERDLNFIIKRDHDEFKWVIETKKYREGHEKRYKKYYQ
jgi:S1-C subfamily serine protease